MQWQRSMQLIDANVILRCILNDVPEMSKRAAEIIGNGAYTKPEVIAEVIYVLKSVYATPKQKIKSIIHDVSESVRQKIQKAYCMLLICLPALQWILWTVFW